MADTKGKKLNDNEMEQVSGGSIGSIGGRILPKFKVGDRVRCPERPDWGIGNVIKVYYDEGLWCWLYDAQFPDFALDPGIIVDGLIDMALVNA